MGLTARRSHRLRARSRAAVSLVVIAAWFGTLLVAAPTSSPASAAPATVATVPSNVSSPSSPGSSASPTWTFDLPADSTSDRSVTPPPGTDTSTDGSDTATATIAITHRPKCALVAAPGSQPADETGYVPCATATGTSGDVTSYSYAPGALTEGTYTLYLHDEQTETATSTTTFHGDGSTTVTPGSAPQVTESGNVAPAPSYTYDATKPSITFTQKPAAQGTAPNPTWTFTIGDADPSTLVCTFSDDTAGTSSTPACSGLSYTPGLTLDDTYTFTVTAADAAGNPGSASSSYTLQSAAAPGITGPTTGNSLTPSFTFSGPAGTPPTEYNVVLTDPAGIASPSAPVALNTPYQPTLDASQPGPWSLAVTATVDGRPSATAHTTYVLDRRKPVVSIVGPDATNPARPSWTVTADEPGTPQCRLTGTIAVSGDAYASAITPCGSTYAPSTDLAEGTYALTATSTDAAGNTGTATSTSYTYDIAPAAPIVVTPRTGNGATATWTVTTQPGSTVTYEVTGPGGFDVTGTAAAGTDVPVQVTMPPSPNVDGDYVMKVTAGDGGGSTSTTATPYVLDRTDPVVTITPPTSATPHANATPGWTVGVTDVTNPNPTFTCAVTPTPPPASDPGSDCTAYASWAVPGQGTWTLSVTARDAAGNTIVSTSAYTYDSVPPNPPGVTLTSGTPTNTHATTWNITTSEPAGYALLCTWTGPVNVPEGTCQAPYFTLPASNGTYTLSVVVRDAAGNRSTPTTGTVLLDDLAPVVSFSNAPATPRNNAVVTWTPNIAESGSGVAMVECQLVKRGVTTPVEAWTTANCGPSVTRTLSAGDGVYYLEVRATDKAGNVVGSGTASADVTLDTGLPDAPTVTGSNGFSQNPSASWTINPSAQADPTATYDCRLVKDNVTPATWVSCDMDGNAGNGLVYATTLPGDGTYVLEVVARDPAGNLSDPVAASLPYTLDRSKPAAPVVTTPAKATTTGYVSSDPSPVWAITGEANATFTCTWTSTVALVPPAAMPSDGPCSNGYRVTLPADGLYTLHVTQTDQAANTSATSTDVDYLLDRQAPAKPVVTSEPAGPSKVKNVQYGFTAEAGAKTECRLLYVIGLSAGSPAPVAAHDWVTCTSPWSITLDQGDGRYQVEIRATDAAGNVSLAGSSGVYVLDTTPPLAPTFTAQPTGTANNKDVTWTWSGEMPSTGTCSLSRTPVGSTTASVVVGPTACDSGTFSANLTYGDGLYKLTVQLTDPTFNAGAFATSADYNLDATPPGAPTVSGPTGTSNKTAVDYAIVGPVEALATSECRLTRDTTIVSDWAACTMPRTIALGVDGSYVLEVRLTDQYGNQGPAGASPAYLLDTKLPTVPVVTAPSSPSANGAPVFGIVTDADTTTTCRLSRGSIVAVDTTSCTGSFTAPLGGQPDGDYVLEVTASDPAGNVATGVSKPYTYDTTKPIAPVVTGPAGPSQVRNPVFSWSGEAGARAECSLQEKAGSAGAWTTCATPYAPSLAADGSWVLSVRLVDAAGNTSDPGQSGAYVFDTTPPATPVVTAPPSPGRDLAPSWSASTEEGSHADCRLSGPGQLGSWAPCTLPMTTSISGDGTYTFEVRTTDVAGNVSAVGTATYDLDTTAPAAPVVAQPTSPGRNRNPFVSFTSEPGTSGMCKLTHGSTVLSDAAPCGSPTTLNLTGLSDGAYTLSVRAIDAAGNIGPAGTATYVLDTTAPAAPTMTLVAGSPSSDRAPQFGFNVELGTTPSCKVTLPSAVVRDLTCTNAVTLDLSGATDGDYVLNVRATDPAGNVSVPATTTYHLDSNAPAAPKVVGPATPGSIRNPVWKISSSSPAECRLLRGTTVMKDWAPCTTSYAADLFAQPDAVYILEARVIGTTAATMSRYRLDTSGPAAATIVGPPSPSTDRKPTWAVSSADTTVHAECRVMVFTGVLKDWAPCAVSTAGSLYTLDLTGLGDGTYSLLVRLTDAAGNVGPTATSDYVLDTSAPAAVGVIAPLSPGNDTTPTWTLTSAAGVNLECRLSSGQKVISDFAPCTGAFTADLSGLPDGTYTLTVHALSAAGTPGPDTTSGYILDTTAAGGLGALSGPTGPSRDRAPRWTFTLPSGTTGVCKVTLAGKVFRDGPCISPFVLDLSNAADGTYTLTVRAIDQAGNPSAPSTANYILKTTPPPAPVLTMTPGSPSSTTDPRWGFSLPRGTSAQCRLLQDGTPLEDWTACGTAGATNGTYTALLSGKPDGRYTVQVRAIDEAQNTSSAVAGDYVFDRSAQPLAIFVDTPPTPSNDTSPTWVVAAPPADATPVTAAGTAALVRAAALTGTPQTECRLTTPHGVGAWAPCSGKYVATTNGDGSYLLEVRAFDSTGARGPASSSSYLLDTKAPAAPRLVDPMPPAVGNDAEVVWSWADDGNLVQCHLLRNGSPLGAFTACDLVYVANVGRLGEATYTIEGRAVDAAGNVSSPPTTDSYRYDITPPAAPAFTSRPAARGSASSVGWTFAVPVDTHALCVVTRNGTVISEGACGSAFNLDLHGQQPATWVLSVHLVDGAGNAGPSSSSSYTLVSAIGRGRVSGPTGNVPPGAPGPGPGSAPGSGPVVVGPGGSNPSLDPQQPRAGALRIPQVVKKTIKQVARVTGAIPGAVPGTDVPKAIKNVLGQTITKPQLPLALFVIVLLFLLVQNRIDRRDPKLAVAPANAEPELTFGPILRPGGATA
jgi:hypothetical protein